LNKKHVVIDPIHGKIEMPHWLVRIKDEPSIRRMMGIKQLGLKAFVDFPGAIHTRYLHSLGTMSLAGKLVSLLCNEERRDHRTGLITNLKNNRNTLMAAGFFHDIGHGPFSHVMDFILKEEFKCDHESITTKVVKSFEKELEGDSIPVNQVNKIITRHHQYPFLQSIVNGPLDVDKVDYVLRDSYHVGLRYSFDLDYFFDQMVILGDENELKKCELGLEKTPQAIACAELFLLLWKSMYTLVYLADRSRISEKMLEKAILYAIRNGSQIKDDIADIDRYMELDEEKLKTKLREFGGFPKDICDKIFRRADLYKPHLTRDIKSFQQNPKFTKDLLESEDRVSERISQQLSSFVSKPYFVICDIIVSKFPKDILIHEKDKEGEPIEIKQKSEVIRAFSEPQIMLKVYKHPGLDKKMKLTSAQTIKEIQKIIDAW
jgi:HD superfamily phosphohydrolase